MQVPFFTLTNYTNIMGTSYEDTTDIERIDVRDIIHFMQTSFIEKFDKLDARQLSAYISNHTLHTSCMIGSKACTEVEALIALKLLMPSLHGTDYFFRNQYTGQEHVGIDIMLPRGTPILSFTEGTVVRVKPWDGTTQNEGNCVVIKTLDNYYVGYEHLETIDIYQGQQITQTTQIGRCGSTGNSTQYHLHLQIDRSSASFHPLRHSNFNTMKQHTLDPLLYLRNIHPRGPFRDLPLVGELQEAILWLHHVGVIKGFEQQCFPDNILQRYEMALLLDRILLSKYMYDDLPIKQPTFIPYQDIDIDDPEFEATIQRLQKYGIMKGHDNHLHPHQPLKGEELLALLGRIFYNLEDTDTEERRQTYFDTFINELLITSTRGYIRQAIPRTEVFLLLWKLLVKQQKISTYM